MQRVLGTITLDTGDNQEVLVVWGGECRAQAPNNAQISITTQGFLPGTKGHNVIKSLLVVPENGTVDISYRARHVAEDYQEYVPQILEQVSTMLAHPPFNYGSLRQVMAQD
jgi:hypothetical protein